MGEKRRGVAVSSPSDESAGDNSLNFNGTKYFNNHENSMLKNQSEFETSKTTNQSNFWK